MTKYDLYARDIMQVEIATVLADATVAEAAQQMRLEGVRSLVIEPATEGDPYGIITYSDIVSKVLAEGLDASIVRVEHVMNKPLITIPPDIKVQFIARLFRQTSIGHAAVVDCGEMKGMVSVTDLITEAIPEP